MKRPAEAVKNFFKPFRRAYPLGGGGAAVILLLQARGAYDLSRFTHWYETVSQGEGQQRVALVDGDVDSLRFAGDAILEGAHQQSGKYRLLVFIEKHVRCDQAENRPLVVRLALVGRDAVGGVGVVLLDESHQLSVERVATVVLRMTEQSHPLAKQFGDA